MKREHKIEKNETQPLLIISGEDGIYDSSPYNHVIINTNVTTQDSSMYFNGSAMLNIDIGDLKITDGIFTLEMWLKLENTTKQYKCIADFCNHSTMYFDASDNRDGTLIIINGAASWLASGSMMRNGTVILTTNWQHVAIVGYGGQNRLFINGIMQTGGYFDTCTNNMNMDNGKIRFGNINYSNLSRYFKGWMKHIKLYNIAKYTSNFTPQ